jgi:hypothetical protein
MFEWVGPVLGVLGFGVTWTMGVIGLTRAVSDIKSDTAGRIADEIIARNKAMVEAAAARDALIDELRREFMLDQKTQDHNFGEMGSALRRFIETVEKEVHAIEIWGRDNFVLKSDFTKATERLEQAIKDMAADIKTDFRELNKKIDESH